MYKVNGELFSCDITDSGIVPSRGGDMQNFAELVFLNGLSKFAQNFTVGFLKLLSTHPIHIVFRGNFPFNIVGFLVAYTSQKQICLSLHLVKEIYFQIWSHLHFWLRNVTFITFWNLDPVLLKSVGGLVFTHTAFVRFLK